MARIGLASAATAASLALGIAMGGSAPAAAQTPGGQTGGTGGGAGSASSNWGLDDAGGTGQLGVRTLGNGKAAPPGTPAAGSSAGDVGRSPVSGAGANGNGGVMSGTAPAAGSAPAAGTAP